MKSKQKKPAKQKARDERVYFEVQGKRIYIGKDAVSTTKGESFDVFLKKARKIAASGLFDEDPELIRLSS